MIQYYTINTILEVNVALTKERGNSEGPQLYNFLGPLPFWLQMLLEPKKGATVNKNNTRTDNTNKTNKLTHVTQITTQTKQKETTIPEKRNNTAIKNKRRKLNEQITNTTKRNKPEQHKQTKTT